MKVKAGLRALSMRQGPPGSLPGVRLLLLVETDVSDPVVWHLFGVRQDEVEASIEAHGEPVCTFDGCGAPAVSAMVGKPARADWGCELSSAAACPEHEPGLLDIVAKLSLSMGEA